MSRLLTTMAVISILSGCSSTPVPRIASNISSTEQNALNALMLQNMEEAGRALDLALADYHRIDDLYGRWRIQSLKTKLALGASQLGAARILAPELMELSSQLNDRKVTYQTSILLGRIHNDDEYFRRAMNHASNRLEQAMVYAYLGEPHKAVQLLDPDDQDMPDNRAFIFYQSGIASGSIEDFNRALGYYRAARDYRGVADSLFRLARISADNTDVERARQYADRAIKALEAGNRPENARIIRNWVLTL